MPKTDKHNVLVFQIVGTGDLVLVGDGGPTQQSAEKWLRDNDKHGDFLFAREMCKRHAEPVTKTRVSEL